MAIIAPLHAQTFDKVLKIKCVVIDAGHGGKDAGAISRNRQIKEKDLALSIALKFGDMIKTKYPDINVIYTRKNDVYIELDRRAAIANKNKADLFISIHINSSKAGSPTGSETFVMGTHKSESNFEICKTENSVITLEDNYESKYEGFDPNSPESYIIFSLLQNTHLEQSLQFASCIQKEYKNGPIKTDRGVKQGGLVVLWRATMPAVLTEVGFISNSSEAVLMNRDETQNAIASCLMKAFSDYKREYENDTTSVKYEKSEPKEDTTATKSAANNVQETKSPNKQYRIQILSIDRKLKSNAPDLKGLQETYYIHIGNLYKYCYGRYDTREEATEQLKNVRKKFKDAFIIYVSE